MAGARALLLDLDPHRILVAVDAHLDEPLRVARGLAFAPQPLARAAVVPGLAARDRLGQRLGIHMGDHQHLARARIGRNAGDEPVGTELWRQRATLLDLFGRATRREHGLIGQNQPRATRRDQRSVPRTMVMKRTCWSGLSRNEPVNWVVIVDEPGFSTPRSDMHMCSAWSMTATPRGLRISSIAVVICEVRCSWVCSRRA